MDIILISVIALVALALIFDFTNGFHDAANSIAAIVATKTLPAKWAPLFAAFFNFIAYFIVGTAVADTVAKTVKHDYVSIAIIFAALFSAIAWNYFTWRVGMPSSSSHAILGGLIGAGIAAGGIEAIAWSSAQKALLGIVLSPIVAFSIAFIVMWIILLIQKIFKMRDSHPVFKGTQLVTSAAVSFGHGANDAQKTMGVIAALLLAAGYTVMDGSNVLVPEWVALSAYSVIALGTLWGGWKIIQTMGLKLTKLHANSGAAADIGASVSIFGATAVGMPISTTQACATAIVGAGAASRGGMNWKVIGQMFLAWAITIPSTVAIAFGVYELTRLPVVWASISITIVVSLFTAWAIYAMRHTIRAKDVEQELAEVG